MNGDRASSGLPGTKHAPAAPPGPKRKSCTLRLCETHSKTACFSDGTGIDISLHGLVAPLVGSLVGRTREIETMTLRKLISVASLLAALSIAGCGDDDVCENCDAGDSREDCRRFLRDCDGPTCEEQALDRCL